MEGKSPCGMVTVTVTGQQMPLSCDISEEAMAEGAKVVGEKVRSSVRRSVSVYSPYFLFVAVACLVRRSSRRQRSPFLRINRVRLGLRLETPRHPCMRIAFQNRVRCYVTPRVCRLSGARNSGHVAGGLCAGWDGLCFLVHGVGAPWE